MIPTHQLFVEPDIERGTYIGQQNFYLTLSDSIFVPFNKLEIIREEIEENDVNDSNQLSSISVPFSSLVDFWVVQ